MKIKTNKLVIIFLAIITIIYSVKSIKISKELEEYSSEVYSLSTPLEKETIEYLCNSFEISENIPECDYTNQVFAGEFGNMLKDYLTSNDNNISINTIKEILQKFLLTCVESNDNIHYCSYDLKGDEVYKLRIYFQKEKIYRILSIWPELIPDI